MGENQGMIWIILGVLVVAGAVIFLGSSMAKTTTISEGRAVAQAANTWDECVQLNGIDEYKYIGTFIPRQAEDIDADDQSEYKFCELITS